MVSIGICGASGCGKSLLVTQLAALNASPALCEGELFPDNIIESIAGRRNPLPLFTFFVNNLRQRLEAARSLSKKKMLCFVDGCLSSAPAHKILEDQRFHDAIDKTYADMDEQMDVDIIILLVCSHQKFKHNIRLRGRHYEQTDAYLQTPLRVQHEFCRLLDGKRNVLVINRDQIDFKKHDDLVRINQSIIDFARRIA